MKEITQTFTIYRNGHLDPEFVRKQRKQAIHNAGMAAVSDVQRLGSVLLHNLGNVASQVIDPVRLDVFDATHGTHLREEYFERKRELAVVAMREEVGL